MWANHSRESRQKREQRGDTPGHLRDKEGQAPGKRPEYSLLDDFFVIFCHSKINDYSEIRPRKCTSSRPI